MLPVKRSLLNAFCIHSNWITEHCVVKTPKRFDMCVFPKHCFALSLIVLTKSKYVVNLQDKISHCPNTSPFTRHFHEYIMTWKSKGLFTDSKHTSPLCLSKTSALHAPVSWNLYEGQRSAVGRVGTRTPALGWTLPSDTKHNRNQKHKQHPEKQHNILLQTSPTVGLQTYVGCSPLSTVIL